MKYGLIGEHLGHSFSKAIHEKIGDYVYEIKEIEPENVEPFIKGKDFLAINVTIPYKEKVIPMLDYIDGRAEKIGAVNTIVNRQGKLYGYNTDYFGMLALINRSGAKIEGKKVLIIGTGGTSKTANAVLNDLGAKEILFVSNIRQKGALSYDEVYCSHTDIDVIFNTSPVGMYPKNEGEPIDILKFPKLQALIDVVYNPIRTKLVQRAHSLGICAEGGLYMLGAQAVFAYEHFTQKTVDKSLCDTVYKSVIKEKDNIILIGMPSSGKSTIGKILAKKTGKEFIDTDKEIIKRENCDIKTIFETHGEEYFRDLEEKIIEDVSKLSGKIISTGGGAILRAQNLQRLGQNGKIYFIDRSLDLLLPTSDRPLSQNREAIEKRYNERYQIYLNSSDIKVNGDNSPAEVANEILKEWDK